MARRGDPKHDVTRPGGRRRAYAHMTWSDHGYLRLGFQNAHWVGPELVRTNQPWPFQLKWWRDRGVRTVINLRGGGYLTGAYVLERDACARLGLTLVDFAVASRDPPSREQVRGAKALFDEIAYPALLHCKSGADRAGLMSVLYAHFRMGLPLREALRRELSLRTLHVRHGKTGVLDYVFERYFEEGEPQGLSFLEWVESPAYDHVRLREAFDAGGWTDRLSDRLLQRE